MQLSVSLSSFFPPGFPGKPPHHNSCQDKNQNSRQASYGKCGDFHWLFRLGPLLHTWCLLPGSVGGTRIVFAMVPNLLIPILSYTRYKRKEFKNSKRRKKSLNSNFSAISPKLLILSQVYRAHQLHQDRSAMLITWFYQVRSISVTLGLA